MIPQPALPIWAIIAVLLLIRTDGVSAEHGDHLEPEDSQLLLGYGRDDYEHVLWKYFSEAYAEDVILRVTAVPALGPREHALGIKRDGDRYSIFYVAPEKLIGHRSDHASARDVPKTACETPIERFVAEDLRTIWKRMVMAVRYPDAVTVGADGTRYHFSVHVYGNVSYGGQIWSPPEHTLTGKLVALSDLMRDYCLHDGAERLRYRARMSRETTALLRFLPR